MSSILDFQKKYHQKIDILDLELLISATINKSREFVLTHPEYVLTKNYELRIKNYAKRRLKHEPVAYILGEKEFYGLQFKVDKNTFIPRPETELIVENVLKLRPKNKTIIDVGTGSGNIIISLAKNLKRKNAFFATDISSKALNIAKQNAKLHKIGGKIKFLCGNLLEPIIQNLKLKTQNFIIVSNLPYLSPKIYSKVSPDIKNYESKSALLSSRSGLGHYEKLFKQIKTLRIVGYGLWVFLEFSPEQKAQLKKAILTAFPQCSITFFKDLTEKFRVVQIKL